MKLVAVGVSLLLWALLWHLWFCVLPSGGAECLDGEERTIGGTPHGCSGGVWVLQEAPAEMGPPFVEHTPMVTCTDQGRSRCCFRRWVTDNVVGWQALGCHAIPRFRWFP